MDKISIYSAKSFLLALDSTTFYNLTMHKNLKVDKNLNNQDIILETINKNTRENNN